MRAFLKFCPFPVFPVCLYFGGGGRPSTPANPQAAAPAAAPLRPPSVTDMQAIVTNPEMARRAGTPATRGSRIFGSAGSFAPSSTGPTLGSSSTSLGTGR